MSATRHAYCSHCELKQIFRRPTPRFALHLLFSLCTLGLWLLPWAILAYRYRKRHWRCTGCGFALHRHP